MRRSARNRQLTLQPLLRQALCTASRALGEAGIDSPRLDAEVLAAHVLAKSRLDLPRLPNDFALAPAQLQRFESLLLRRVTREPVAYLTGEREFWSLPFRVGPQVLIPRPESELLVELSLALCPQARAVIDVGTGCGALACAISSELPLTRVLACDISAAALELARHNIDSLGLSERVKTHATDLLAGLPAASTDLIISNPPYVSTGEWPELAPEVRAEPSIALVAGPDGLDLIRSLLAQARLVLRPGGWMLLEHGSSQGSAVRALLEQAGCWQAVSTHRDLAGHERVTSALLGHAARCTASTEQ